MLNRPLPRTACGSASSSAVHSQFRLRNVACIAVLMSLAAHADPLQAAEPAVPINQPSQEARSFDIPSGPLAEMLGRFVAETGVFVSADGALTAGKTSRAVRGSYTPIQALTELLIGTGLQPVDQGAGGYALSPVPIGLGEASLLPAVKVTAETEALPGDLPVPYAGGQVARGGQVGLLGNGDYMETPFSISSYTEEAARTVQARRITDVLRIEPAVRVTFPESQPQEALTIRGFGSTLSGAGVDGLYGIATGFNYIAIEPIERIELIKGPSALLNGIQAVGSIGGAVNLVTKKATDTPVTRLTTRYIEQDQIGVHLDVGRRFGSEGSFGVRANLVQREGDTAIDDQSIDQQAGSLALDYRGQRARAFVNFNRQKRDIDSFHNLINVAPGIEVPDAPDAGRSYAQPWEDHQITEERWHGRFEYDLGAATTAYIAHGRVKSDSLFAANLNLTINSPDGTASGQAGTALRIVTHESSEVGLRSTFETGPVTHRVAVAATRFQREFGRGDVDRGPVVTTNIYQRVLAPEPALVIPASYKAAESDFESYALADTLGFADDRLLLTLGVRNQKVFTQGFNADGTSSPAYDKSATTPAFGAVFKATDHVSIYGNYIEGLSPGATAPATGVVNPGEVFPPFKSEQYELGAKADLSGLGLTAALFQIAQPSGIRVPTSDPLLDRFAIDGEQRHRGLELSAFGEPIKGWRLIGGLALIEAEQVKTAGGINDGKKGLAVPETVVSLNSEWDIRALPGLTLTGRALNVASQFLDAGNTQIIPSWTTFDLGMAYGFMAGNSPARLQLSVENVADENYWASAASGLALGSPRTILVSASFDL